MTNTPDTQSLRAHWDLDPEVAFLNHGSFGACPRVVLEEQARLRRELEHGPVLFMGREISDRIDVARGALARFVGAAPEDLVFVSNATTGVNAVLRSLEFEAGDELLVTDHGYNACRNAAEFVCQRAGASVVVAALPFPLSSPDEVLEAILARVTPKTRLALIDHITSPTGLVLPIERIVAELRERGVDTLVDGAHGPGMLPLDLESLGAAYYTGNCHKWICSPKGAALLHVRRDRQEGLRPAVISHGANSPRPGYSRFQDEFDWVGTDDPTACLSVPAAIDFLGAVLPGGWPAVYEQNQALALTARSILCEALNLDPPAPESMLGTLVSLPLPPGDPDTPTGAFSVDPTQQALFDQHRIEVPIMTWPAAPGRLLRMSAQLYNDESQYRALGKSIAELLSR